MPTPPPPSRPRAYPIGSLFRGIGKASQNVYRLVLQDVGGEYRENVPESEVELLIPEAAHVSELVDSAVELTGGGPLPGVAEIVDGRDADVRTTRSERSDLGYNPRGYIVAGDLSEAMQAWWTRLSRSDRPSLDAYFNLSAALVALVQPPAVDAAKNKEQIRDLHNGLELAWGIIANAYDGDWAKAPEEWRKAAERWRDGVYHPALPPPTAPSGPGPRKPPQDATDLLRAEVARWQAIAADQERDRVAWKRLVNEIEKAAGMTAFATAPDQSAPVLDTVRALCAFRSVAAAREQDQARKHKDLMDDREMYIRAWHRELGFLIPNKSHMIDALVLRTRQIVEALRDYSPAKAKAVLDRAEFPEPTRKNLTPERAANLSAAEAVDDWVERNGVRLSAKDTVDLYGVVATMITAGRPADSPPAPRPGPATNAKRLPVRDEPSGIVLPGVANTKRPSWALLEAIRWHANRAAPSDPILAIQRILNDASVVVEPTLTSEADARVFAEMERAAELASARSDLHPTSPPNETPQASGKEPPRPESTVKVDRRRWMMNRLAIANRNLEEDGYDGKTITDARAAMTDARRFIETGGEYPRPANEPGGGS